MGIKTKAVEAGTVALIQQTESGRILQIGMTAAQSEMLQIFLATISQGEPLIQMGEDYDLILKSRVCKRCLNKNP